MNLPEVDFTALESQVDVRVEDEDFKNVAEHVYLVHNFYTFFAKLG